MRTLLPILSALSVVAATGCASLTDAAPVHAGYGVVARYEIGGAGGWDYVSVDEKRHRLYVSRGDHVQVVDTISGKVAGDLPGTAGVHGIAIAGDLGLGFTSNGRADTVTVFDLDTLAVVDTIKVTGSSPDAILYEPFSKRVLTFNGRSANVTAIDAKTRKVIGTLAVSGKPEFAVTDGHGRVFVNIEDRNAVAVIDMAAFTVARQWSLGSCDSPTGLAIDRRRERLFSVCGNEKMIALDARTGSVLQELAIGAGVDGVEFDAGPGLVFSSNGDGTVTVVKADEAGRYSVAETVATQKRARTLALDSTTHRIYLPTASFGPAPAATAAQPNPRAPMIPDTFVILVLAPGASR
jgi:DNA-binding beta-propeller fold protein YncE